MDNASRPFVETARNGDPVGLARLLVSIPSVNPSLARGGAGETEIAATTAQLLRDWGFDVEVREAAPSRPNVVAHLEGEGPHLLLNGHLDTVGVDGMTVDPWKAALEGDRLIGRGSCDMKGGVAALMSAGYRLATNGPRPRLTIALTADEEHASVGMAALVAGGSPVADLAVVCEPTELALMPAHKGFVWLEASFRGRAAHGSRPDVGVDAIRHAGLYLAALDGYAAELTGRDAHPLLGHGSFHAGTIVGGTAESIYPDQCTLLLERRTMPGERDDEVVSEFRAVLDRLADSEPTLDASLEKTLARPGSDVPTDHNLVTGLLGAMKAEGLRQETAGMTAWVDAAFLNESGVPAVCFGPGSIEQAHTEDEWIEVAQIGRCADVLERFARSLVV